MIGSVGEIRVLRKRHNLTQKKLAELSGVSQSFIAKVEAGLIDPGYSSFRKVYDCLAGMKEKSEPRASDLMNRKIISVRETCYVKDAVGEMKRHGISQLLAVSRKGGVTGLVSEADVLERVQKGKSIGRTKVSEIMQGVPPTVPKNTPLKAVIELLRFSSLVIVADKGGSVGVITKSDVLNRLSGEKF